MRVLGVDFEATDKDPKTARIIEIGAVLWDTDEQISLKQMSALVRGTDYPELSQEIVGITGIQQKHLLEFGTDPKGALFHLLELSEEASFIVAHNANRYDKPLLMEELLRSKELSPSLIACGPWIDTMTDIPYPPGIKARKLTHLAAEHGFLNPFPHRAVSDVLTMLKILSTYPIGEIVRYASAPSLTVRADVSYKTRDKAKARGYHWDGEKQIWTKDIKEFQLDEECKQSDFKVLVLKGKS